MIWVLLAGCGWDPARFTEEFAVAACDQEQRCEPASWRLLEGELVCREEAAELVVWGEIDPCLSFDAEAARSCVTALRQAGCEDAERVLLMRFHPDCGEVYLPVSECAVEESPGASDTDR